MKTNEGKIYSVAESRNFPLWFFASDVFIPKAILTKAASMLGYNEKGSLLENSFSKFWYAKMRS